MLSILQSQTSVDEEDLFGSEIPRAQQERSTCSPIPIAEEKGFNKAEPSYSRKRDRIEVRDEGFLKRHQYLSESETDSDSSETEEENGGDKVKCSDKGKPIL